MALEYDLTFAGVPFVIDVAKVVRLPAYGQGEEDEVPGTPKSQLPPRKHQPLEDLVDENDRLLPFQYLNEFKRPNRNPGRNLGAIAHVDDIGPFPNNEIRIGDWYYPTTASRWSVFRGLALSSMVKEMLLQTKGRLPKTFKMLSNPCSPDNPANNQTQYTLSTQMRMLPPRPIGEHGGTFNGLYLVTLVDERYYWQNEPVSLRVTKGTTWESLLTQLATLLDVTITYSAISAAYGQPEPDSQLWTNAESAPLLLDAIAYNIGRVVVRLLSGAYELMTPVESRVRVLSNRGSVNGVVRTAGGDMFVSGNRLPVGDLFYSKNAIVPDSIRVTFPKYVRGDDPIPHFVNSRYANQRPSCWYEESYGDVHSINIKIQSGGAFASGLSGTINDYSLHTTAKAIYETEAAATGDPVNQSGLQSLALQLAQDYYGSQTAAALDEVYPGTFNWTPEGIHDIIWTYSARARQGVTRVLRAEWNQTIREFQHSAVALAGYTNVVKGVGGPSVPQTWRDSWGSDYSANTTLSLALGITGATATFSANDHFPTQNRWKAQCEDEIMLMEGTSGGVAVGIVFRGIDGTIAAAHAAGSTINQVDPNAVYGVNSVVSEKMQWIFPGVHSSGGVQEAVVIPQTQSVYVFSASGANIGGTMYYSGQVQSYNPTVPGFTGLELVWVAERNDDGLLSGKRYDGQFAGFSKSGQTSPIYLINTAGSGLGGGGGAVLSGTLQWFHFVACGMSGLNCSGWIFSHHINSGQIIKGHIASGAVCSGKIGSGSVNLVNLASGVLINRLLDGDRHVDTFSGFPERGQIIVGNSGSTWQKFPVGNSGQTLILNPDQLQGVVWGDPPVTSGVNPHTILFPDIHTDTVSGVPTRGALIVGNSGGKWEKLDRGSENTLPISRSGNLQGMVWDKVASGNIDQTFFNSIGTRDLYFYRFKGTNRHSGGRWYADGLLSIVDHGGTTISSGEILVQPFLAGQGGVADRMAINVAGISDSGARVHFGIYDNKADNDLYPNTLLAGSEVTTYVSGNQTKGTIAATLAPGGLYWLAVQTDRDVGGVLDSSPTPLMQTIFGLDDTLQYDTTAVGYRASGTAFETLPSPFTSGLPPWKVASYIYPIIFMRYA